MRRDTHNYLDYIPVRNEGHVWEASEKGSVTIFVENRGIFHWLAQHLLKKPRISQIHLEEFGSFIWLTIDGKRSLFEIGQQLKQHFGDSVEPLYPRLVQYIKNLEDYGFISVREDSHTSKTE